MYAITLGADDHYFHSYADAAYFARYIGSPARPWLNLSKTYGKVCS